MKKIMFKSFCFLAVCLMFAGCDPKLGDGVKLKDIQVLENSARIHIGNTGRLYAYPVPYDSRDYHFTWRSSAPEIVSVDNYGNIMAKDFGNVSIFVSESGKFEKEIKMEVYEVPLLDKVKALNVNAFWNFMDAGNLFKDVVGGYELIPSPTSVGKWEQVNGYNNRSKALKTVSNTSSERNHLIFNHNFPATPGTYGGINEYTFLIDAYFPGDAGGLLDGGTWTNGRHFAIFQTDPNNLVEAGLFFRNNGEWGVRNAYTPNRGFVRNEWRRYVIVVKLGAIRENTVIKYYKDNLNVLSNTEATGGLYNEANTQGGHGTWRFTVDGVAEPVYLFGSSGADHNGNGLSMHVASLGIWTRALTADEVRTLGAVPIY